ncbi:MAG: hypothetical protein AB7H86_06660 [Blastocatellales bacterium]
MFQLAGQAISGLVIGTLAMLRKQRPETGNVVVTALLGLAGSVIATVLIRAFEGPGHYLIGWAISIVGAMSMIQAYRFLARRLTHQIATQGKDSGRVQTGADRMITHTVNREGRRQ